MYEKFEALCVEKGVTAYRVSKDTGIAQSILSKWKNKGNMPKVDKLIILADYFDVPVTQFILKPKKGEKHEKSRLG